MVAQPKNKNNAQLILYAN